MAASLMLGAMASAAGAADAVWVPTQSVQTGAQERLAALRDGSVWAVVDHDRVLRSTDAGQTWLPVNPVPVQVDGVTVPLAGPHLGGSSDTLVAPESAATALGANGGALSITRDGGITWQPLAMPAAVRARAFEFAEVLKRGKSTYWLAKGGFDDDNGCPRQFPTTPVLRSADARSWRHADIPFSAGTVVTTSFADDVHGAALVWETKWGPAVRDGNSCSMGGIATTTGLYVTGDAGAHWRRALACKPACRALSWSSLGRLMVGRADGAVFLSKNGGGSFRQFAPVPVTNSFGLDAMDCVGERCWALVNGGGIYRHDGSGEWSSEVSAAAAPGLNIGDLAAVDRERAVAAGPSALSTRLASPAAAGRMPPARALGASYLRIGPFATLGADGVFRERVTVTG